MDEQRQDDSLEPTYNSSMPIQDVAFKTYQKRWTIEKGDGRGSGRSILMARHDDEISAAELGYGTFSFSSEVLFSYFFFNFCLIVSTSKIPVYFEFSFSPRVLVFS